jgi:diguanylate cyclase (GGDEF)-like protein/PAS domain S-box-containing protein
MTNTGDHVTASRSSLVDSVMRAVNIGAIVLDCDQRVVLWNHWMETHSGCDADSVLGRSLFDVFPELNNTRIHLAVGQALRENFQSILSQTLNKSPFSIYTTITDRERGQRMQQAVAVIPLKVNQLPRHCLIQITDVSIAVAREKLLRDQALVLRSQTFSDGLTGIANRRHFDVDIEKEVRRAKRTSSSLSLALIDIDYFKAYNDHYGHQQGDECLIQVACVLASMMRRPADLVARYGGEEFGIILPDTDAEHAAIIAEMIRAQIEERAFAHDASPLATHVTVSIGVATRTLTQHLEVAELIGNADRALYQAKRSGRNRVVIHNANDNTQADRPPPSGQD